MDSSSLLTVSQAVNYLRILSGSPQCMGHNIKGIFSDSNSKFFYDINQKIFTEEKVISKISVNSDFWFMCIGSAP